MIKKKLNNILSLILLFLVFSPIFLSNNQYIDKQQSIDMDNEFDDENSIDLNPESSAITDYSWWDEKYEFRILVELSPNEEDQRNAPVELYVNFTQYLLENNVNIGGERLNTTNLIVVEQDLLGMAMEYETQYDPMFMGVSPNTDQGEVVWIIDKAFESNLTFFIYFCFGNLDKLNNPIVASPYSLSLSNNPIRIYHLGFEDPDWEVNEASLFDDQDYPTTGDIYRNETSPFRGDAHMSIRGNRWLGLLLNNNTEALTAITGSLDPDLGSFLHLTYAFRVIDTSPASIEIVTIGPAETPDTRGDIYMTQHWGSQSWGQRQDNIDPSELNTWIYETQDLQTLLAPYSWDINYIEIGNDDDSSPSPNRGVDYDDFSIWSRNVSIVRNAPLIYNIVGLQRVSSNLNLKVLDLDGLPLPNALVFISNDTYPEWNQNGTTNSFGEITFTNVSVGRIYNITVNYSGVGVDNPQEFTVGTYNNLKLNDFQHNETISTSAWSMEFYVNDYEGIPVDNAHVIIYDNMGVPLTNVSLDENGYCIMRYQNISKEFNYTVWLDTTEFSGEYDYSQDMLNISSGIISRKFIDQPNIYYHSELLEPEWALKNTINGTSTGNEIMYTTLTSSYFNNQTFGYFQLDMAGFSNNIVGIQVDATMTDDSVETVIFDDSSNPSLYNVSYSGSEMVDLYWIIEKDTTSTVGQVNLTYSLRPKEIINCNITTLTFNISALTDHNTMESNQLLNALVLIYNETDDEVAQILTTVENNGIFDFTYYRMDNPLFNNYSYEVQFVGQLQNLNNTDTPTQSPLDWDKDIDFNMDVRDDKLVYVNFLGEGEYKTYMNITKVDQNDFVIGNLYNLDWQETIDISLNFTADDNSTIYAITGDSVSFSIYDQDFGFLTSGSMVQTINTGEYNYTFDSTSFAAGESYQIIFDGVKLGYPSISGDSLNKISIQINEINSALGLFNSTYDNINDTRVIETVWKENFTMTIYYNETLGGSGLADADIRWRLGGNSLVNGKLNSDTMGDGWYSVNLNSTLFNEARIYFLTITASKSNYISQTIEVTLNIQEVYTLINGSITPIRQATIYRNAEVYFDYKFLEGKEVNSVNIFTEVSYEPEISSFRYTWNSVDQLLSGDGELSWNPTKKVFTLDFDTETLPIGSYEITLKFEKQNYETRISVLFLTIEPIDFIIDVVEEESHGFVEYLSGTQNLLRFSEKMDETVDITLNLKSALTNLDLDDVTVEWVNTDTINVIEFTAIGNGKYTISILCEDDRAFYQQQLIQGEIRISSLNFDNLTITTQITVEMPVILESIIDGGVPIFYFALIVGALGIVAISLGANKVIKKARIPVYVRLLDDVSKSIQKKKTISENNIVRSLNEMLISEYGSMWKMLDLDIKDTLEIKQGEDNLGPGDNNGDEF